LEAVVDTNVLIARIIEDDVNHEKAKKLLDKLRKWYLPSIVIHELVWFLKNKNLDLDLALQFILHEKAIYVEIVESDIVFAINESKYNPKDYNDFLILSVAKRLGKQLLTFDEDLKRKYFAYQKLS